MWIDFAFGCGGGFGAQVVSLYQLKRRCPNEFHSLLGDWSHWVMVTLMIIMGGVVVLAYDQSKQDLTALLSMNIGASAPLILENFAGGMPSLVDHSGS